MILRSSQAQHAQRAPLHRQIAEQLRGELSVGSQAGARFASQNELARRFDVTPNTVREAVALLVQQGLLERRCGSGTYVTGNRPRTYVGVVTELDLSHAAVSPFFLHLIQSVRRRLAAAGHETRLYAGHATPFADTTPDRITAAEFWTDLENDTLCALVDVGCPAGIVRQAVGERPIPVFGGGSIDGRQFVDYLELVRLGVKALAQRGCREVACVDLGAPDKSSDRRTTFCAEVSRLGLLTRPAWVVATEYRHERGDGAAAFRQLWLSGEQKPDGLLVLDEILYRDLAPMLLLNQIRVPGDLVAVSHLSRDDSRPLLPAPIGLAVDADDVGAAIVSNLLKRLGEPNAPVEGLPVPIRVVEPRSTVHMELPARGSPGRVRPARRVAARTGAGARAQRSQPVLVGAG